ncbi:MAG: hypothetical protein E7390_09300 [Ruminococcaceae bacterium]|nr:hypothetical protein [Oscillospiraceae bacterium]
MAIELKYISKGEMPPEGKYIAIYVERGGWCDSDDQNGVYWKVAKTRYGITMEERLRLEKSDSFADRIRAGQYRPEDEGMNNKKPYCFDEFGPDKFFGQDVDVWFELPDIG